MKGTEERLVELEIRVTEQEDLIDKLDEVIVAQQATFDRLASRVEALMGRVQELSSKAATAGPADEKPPHY